MSQPTASAQPTVTVATLTERASHPDNVEFVERAEQFVGAVPIGEIRRQIPSAFRDCVDRLVLYERAEDEFRFLMFGSVLSRLLSLEATGLRFSHAFGNWPDLSTLAASCARRVIDDGRVSGLVGGLLFAGVRIDFETATVPVFSPGGRPELGFGHIALILPPGEDVVSPLRG